jgi:RNA polymerase sigma-70 factor (ECF subfamily)
MNEVGQESVPSIGRKSVFPRALSLQTHTDAELVARSQNGDARAFNSVVGRWESSLYAFVRRTLGDSEDARDVCQETLVKAHANIGRLRDGEKFKAWIHHIALNLCRDRFRSVKGRADMISLDETGSEEIERSADVFPSSHSEHVAHRIGVQEVLASILAKIPEEQRASILLREYQGFTSEEIGNIMGVPAATVRTRIYYGLRTLRKELDQRGISRADLT